MALDYLGRWCLAVDYDAGGSLTASASLTELRARRLAAGERISLPPVTIGVFRDDLDDMGRSLYDWQYEYMWDYTNDEWYALMQFTTAWWADSHNLQEQFAGRLAYLDMDWTEYLREAGLDVLWDDAGWAANPDIWAANREGPDFAQTVRYIAKTGMKWCLWFPGDPTSGIMDTKVGSWGNFQWRTDALGFNFNSDHAFREEVAGSCAAIRAAPGTRVRAEAPTRTRSTFSGWATCTTTLTHPAATSPTTTSRISRRRTRRSTTFRPGRRRRALSTIRGRLAGC